MRVKLVGSAVCAWFVCSLNVPAFAWFDFGHEAVACIAYGKLTAKTKERVDGLLKLNPYYDSWLENIRGAAPKQDKKMMIFMLASTWPDAIKKDQHYKSDGAEAGNKPDSPECARNIGYSDFRLHKYWHFADNPFSTDKTPLPPLVAPNAATEIDLMRATLASDSADELKSFDLTWLIHLVGDVHEPLHCARRVSKDSPMGDKGGNDVKLKSDPGGPKNLHELWDGAPGSDRSLESAMKYAQSLPDANAKLAAKRDAKVWVREGLDLCRKKIYKGPIKDGLGPYVVNERYRKLAESTSAQRVELAGARLANLLNSELK